MRSREDRIGLKSGWFLTVMPYSVSIPMTFGIAIGAPLGWRQDEKRGEGGPLLRPRALTPRSLQVLTGIDYPLDVPLLVLRLADERLDVDDALALLAGDLRPVVETK